MLFGGNFFSTDRNILTILSCKAKWSVSGHLCASVKCVNCSERERIFGVGENIPVRINRKYLYVEGKYYHSSDGTQMRP